MGTIVSNSNHSILYPRGHLNKILDLVADPQPDDLEDALDQYILELCFTSVCQKLISSRWESPLLHFLARRGIHSMEAHFLDASQYSQTLAAVVFGARLLVYYHLTLTMNRESEGTSLYSQLKKVHREYLHDQSDAPMGEMLSLLAYAMAKAKAGTNQPSIVWESEETMYFKGEPVSKAGFRSLAQSLLDKTKDCLHRHLLLNGTIDASDIDLISIKDGITGQAAGFSFLNDKRNLALDIHQTQLLRSIVSLNEVGLYLYTTVDEKYFWRPDAVAAYLQHMQHFLNLLAVLVHITGGLPLRGTELLTMRYANGPTAIRNVYVQGGQVMIVLDYCKTTSQHRQSKSRAYFLPKAVRQLLVTYFACVIPFVKHLYQQTHQTPPKSLSSFVFIHLDKDIPLPTQTLTKTLKSETRQAMGWGITTASWRHVAIGWNCQLRRTPGNALEGKHMEDDNKEVEDVNDLQAGHSSAVAKGLYGVEADMAHGLTPELIARFQAISGGWHAFLGLRGDTANFGGAPPAQSTLSEAATAALPQTTRPHSPPRQTTLHDSRLTLADTHEATPRQQSMPSSTPLRSNHTTLVITPRRKILNLPLRYGYRQFNGHTVMTQIILQCHTIVASRAGIMLVDSVLR